MKQGEPPSPGSPRTPKRKNMEENPTPPNVSGGPAGITSTAAPMGSSGASLSGSALFRAAIGSLGSFSGFPSGDYPGPESERTCTTCNKVFGSTKGLHGHLWVHRKPKPKWKPQVNEPEPEPEQKDIIEDVGGPLKPVPGEEGRKGSSSVVQSTVGQEEWALAQTSSSSFPFDLNSPAQSTAQPPAPMFDFDLNMPPPSDGEGTE
ncbi:hypothetical protein Nepgr_000279 [Nepenthes gracilis]|uniref:C2H2-type domain-containing protein n=1 Tax=Nepenthes gracilis TaxID=150966 RepID=A0AAD3P1N3_NEPGR|nr:hypothetical protein Nepgr_000279 [Nepenthes gracilis]